MRPGRAGDRLAVACLLGVTLAWGTTFTVVKDAVERMPVLDFLAFRFGLAALVLVVLAPRRSWRLDRRGRRHGLLLGLVLGAGYVTQTFGLQYTSAAVSGFITGMFVVFTPLVAGLVLRRPVPASAWAGSLLAGAGLTLLSGRGFAPGPGELLTLACALAFAVHIVGLGGWARHSDPYPLAVAQLAVVAVVCALPALPGGIALPPDPAAWLAVVATAVFATALAFLGQTWAQSRLSPVRTAVILTMEPVFAGAVAVAAGERLGPRAVLGAAAVLAAMYLVELGGRGPGAAADGPDRTTGRLEA